MTKKSARFANDTPEPAMNIAPGPLVYVILWVFAIFTLAE